MTRTLALIPARAGSKGLPGKNVRDFCGKPLWVWAAEIGLQTCDKTCVSTDLSVLNAKLNGVYFIRRPSELAQDDTPMYAVAQHAILELDHLRPDILVILQPTSPLRAVEHVQEALRLLETRQADSVVSVVKIPSHHCPDYAGIIKPDDRIVFPYTTRRQDVRPAYYRDGTVYATRTEFIREGNLYGHKCIPMILSEWESATIDTEEDFKRAEKMMKVPA